ncbi:MAG TPA: hypothetical protein VFJ09_02390 [Nocardioidaceae bacterium]|nr:hypothetical protein [Nocardioidaceae bacterium]
MTTYMHIGAPKTGTTFVQNVLAKNRDLLRSLGVCYPGERKDHYFAARDLVAPITGLEPPAEGAWARAVAEARAWPGETVVISHEHFRHADPPTIERIVTELGPDLRVIVTARDVARQVSSLWQESVKNGNTTDFAVMLTRLQHQLAEGSNRLGPMARTIHLANVLEPWCKVLPASAITVVTMPRGRASELWDRFAGVIGVDPSGFDTDVPLNPGMGIGATEFVRRLNESLEDGELATKDYERLVKHRLAGRMLTQHQGDQRIVVPAAHHDWLTQWARGQVEALAVAGYSVLGDLEDLVPGPAAQGRAEATEEQVAAAGVYAAHSLLLRWARLEAATTPLNQSPAGRARALVRKLRARVRSRSS